MSEHNNNHDSTESLSNHSEPSNTELGQQQAKETINVENTQETTVSPIKWKDIEQDIESKIGLENESKNESQQQPFSHTGDEQYTKQQSSILQQPVEKEPLYNNQQHTGQQPSSINQQVGEQVPYYQQQTEQQAPYYQQQTGQQPPYYQQQTGQQAPYYQQQTGQQAPYYQQQTGQQPPYYQQQTGQQAPYYQQQAGQQQQTYYQQQFNPQYQQPPVYQGSKTNNKAIAAFILSLTGILIPIVGFITAVISLFLAPISMKEISRSPVKQDGRGLAIAGLVISICVVIFYLLYIILFVVILAYEI